MEFDLILIATVILVVIFFVILAILMRSISTEYKDIELQADIAFDQMRHGSSSTPIIKDTTEHA